jgi:hypothetical protein
VLEEPAEELEGFQIDVGPLAGGAVAIGPTQSAIGEEIQATIAGGGLEDVTVSGSGAGGGGGGGRRRSDSGLRRARLFLCMGREVKVGIGGATGTRAPRSAPSLELGRRRGNENRSNRTDGGGADPIQPAPPQSGFVQQNHSSQQPPAAPLRMLADSPTSRFSALLFPGGCG